jgi:hypothetical protein
MTISNELVPWNDFWTAKSTNLASAQISKWQKDLYGKEITTTYGALIPLALLSLAKVVTTVGEPAIKTLGTLAYAGYSLARTGSTKGYLLKSAELGSDTILSVFIATFWLIAETRATLLELELIPFAKTLIGESDFKRMNKDKLSTTSILFCQSYSQMIKSVNWTFGFQTTGYKSLTERSYTNLLGLLIQHVVGYKLFGLECIERKKDEETGEDESTAQNSTSKAESAYTGVHDDSRSKSCLDSWFSPSGHILEDSFFQNSSNFGPTQALIDAVNEPLNPIEEGDESSHNLSRKTSMETIPF